MPQPDYDVVVAGLGAMGAAAAYQAAKRGMRVLGLDRFAPPHGEGSTHGETRITRLAIGEGAHYTPIVMRSHELWREIERATGVSLLTQCGGLFISSRGKQSKTHVEGFFDNTVDAAERFGIAHERLDAAAMRARFPQFLVGEEEYGYLEPAAGFVRPEDCVAAQLALAEKYGAALHRGETVLAYETRPDRVVVTTDKGSYGADRLILAVGAWLPSLLDAKTAALFKVYRQVQFWFEIADSYRSGPVFIWELPRGRNGIYGFPSLDGATAKVATEHYLAETSPDAIVRAVSDEESATMYRDLVQPYLLGIDSRTARAAACLYTVTPDHGFVIDALDPRVTLCSACSGHGFKHSAAIGEALAERAAGGPGRLDLEPFRISRFAS